MPCNFIAARDSLIRGFFVLFYKIYRANKGRLERYEILFRTVDRAFFIAANGGGVSRLPFAVI